MCSSPAGAVSPPRTEVGGGGGGGGGHPRLAMPTPRFSLPGLLGQLPGVTPPGWPALPPALAGLNPALFKSGKILSHLTKPLSLTKPDRRERMLIQIIALGNQHFNKWRHSAGLSQTNVKCNVQSHLTTRSNNYLQSLTSHFHGFVWKVRYFCSIEDHLSCDFAVLKLLIGSFSLNMMNLWLYQITFESLSLLIKGNKRISYLELDSEFYPISARVRSDIHHTLLPDTTFLTFCINQTIFNTWGPTL